MLRFVFLLCLVPFIGLCQSQYLETSVLVVGGGTSGVAAGIQSARMGVKTIIVEETPWLGGMLTSAGVSATDGNHLMPSGLWGEFRAAVEKHYGGAENLKTGWVSNTMFEPSVGAKIFLEMARKERYLGLMLETCWREVFKTNKGWILYVEGKDGKRCFIRAKELIDATELGDVAVAAGVRFDVGMEARSRTGEQVGPEASNRIVQDLTYVATLKDFGPEADKTLPKLASYDREAFLCACKKFCLDLTRPRLFDCEKMLTYGLLPNKKYLINWPISGNDYFANLIDASTEKRQELLTKAKEHTLNFVYFIQTELGYKNLGLADDEYPTLDGLPMLPYHRESRRMQGVVRLTMEPIARPFDFNLYRTGIAVGDYAIDHHHAKYPDKTPDLHFVPVPSYNVPMGVMIPETVEHLLVVEKSISVSNIANGTTRLQPVVLQLGQAAGATAALAIKKKTSPRLVAVRAVQDALLAAGGYLMPYLDVPKTHPNWAAIQRIGATGFLRGKPESWKWENRTWFYPDSSMRRSDLWLGEKTFFGQERPTGEATQILTHEEAVVYIQELVQHHKILLKKSLPKPLSRRISRAEFAQLLDECLDLFHTKNPHLDGNFD